MTTTDDRFAGLSLQPEGQGPCDCPTEDQECITRCVNDALLILLNGVVASARGLGTSERRAFFDEIHRYLDSEGFVLNQLSEGSNQGHVQSLLDGLHLTLRKIEARQRIAESDSS